jgi:uncharacterized protein GlcG (DUF336 family)
VHLDLEMAQGVVTAATAKATELGLSMCIAVLDSGGHLKAFARMDHAWLGSIDVAARKARTSVLFEAETQAVWEACKPGAQAEGLQLTNDVLVTFAGGIPLRSPDGRIAGAIGVSGGQVLQDAQVARAGASVFDSSHQGG